MKHSVCLRCHLDSHEIARTLRNADTFLSGNGEYRCAILSLAAVPAHPLRSICPMRCCRDSTIPGSLQTRFPVLLPRLWFDEFSLAPIFFLGKPLFFLNFAI